MPTFLSDILGWLRAGYPDGVPERDYIPLFALLGRHLTDNEVQQVAEQLAGTERPALPAGHPRGHQLGDERAAARLRHQPGAGPSGGRRLAAGAAGRVHLSGDARPRGGHSGRAT